MVRKARVWFDDELGWNPSDHEGGGVAVQSQTAILTELTAADAPFESPAGDKDEEETPLREVPPTTAARHLAGANWLDDWTSYWPSTTASKTVRKK